jgi:para-nitrobenzyl esterase
MKHLYLGAIALFISSIAVAQCTDDRYRNFDYFSNYEVIQAVNFGSNNAVVGGPQSLFMDIYQPMGDTETARPVVLVAFGGSFVGGSRDQVEGICNELTRLGYVAVAPDYRIGLFSPNQVTTTLAVMRGAHDMKACVRYLRKTVAEDGNPYKIDPDMIFSGGVSAGAISAIHAAYFDSDSEIPAYMANDTAGLGGVEGNSGSPGYNSIPQGVFSMSGAIGDTAWMADNDVPIISWHEQGDGTVPYLTQEVAVGPFPTGLIASGSFDLHVRADNAGMDNCFNGYPGNGHVGYLNNSNYPEVMGTLADFLGDIVCDDDVNCGTTTYTVDGTDDNQIIQDPNGIEESILSDLKVYPNPAANVLNIELSAATAEITGWQLIDLQGRVVLNDSNKSNRISIDVNDVENGIYLVSVFTDKTQVSVPVMIN